MIVGSVLSVVGLYAYLVGNSTLNLVGFFYGIPLLLGGLALKAAELKPVPFSQPTSANVVALRTQQATPIQNQIRQDVTRYRYGQRAHLDSSLAALGLRPTDEERPVLIEIQEVETNGAYTLVLKFESPLIPLEIWQQKQQKLTSFFGPGIEARVSQPQSNQIELALVATPQT